MKDNLSRDIIYLKNAFLKKYLKIFNNLSWDNRILTKDVNDEKAHILLAVVLQ